MPILQKGSHNEHIKLKINHVHSLSKHELMAETEILYALIQSIDGDENLLNCLVEEFIEFYC